MKFQEMERREQCARETHKRILRVGKSRRMGAISTGSRGNFSTNASRTPESASTRQCGQLHPP